MQNNMFIGLDVHKATISVAVAQGEGGGEVRHWGTVPHRPDHVRKLVEKLSASGARLHRGGAVADPGEDGRPGEDGPPRCNDAGEVASGA